MSAAFAHRLRVAPARGPAEREADRAAERAVRAGDPVAPEPLRAAGCAEIGPPAPETVHEVLRSPGAPLAPAERALLGTRPGLDPSEVRVHAGARAAASARALGALAYTVGRDVVFAAGRLAPATPAGRRLLAHELAHVAQQRGTPAMVQRQEAPERAEPHLAYADDARALREAMDVKPLGTDEERIYEILRAARPAAGGVQALEYAYAIEIGSLLENDLRAELGGGDLELALALLGRTARVAGPGGSPAAHPAAAARLHAAIHGLLGPDARTILAVLVPYQGDIGRIGELKGAYAGTTGSGAALEDDLKAELGGEDLRQALELLHGPREAPAGMPALLLGEAERATAPGTPCSVASVVRYLRAHLDHWYLDGRLLATEQLRAQDPAAPEVVAARAALAQDLDALLGGDGARFLDGGPAVAVPPDADFWTWLRRVLTHESLFGQVDGRRMNLLWQIAADEDAGQGAPLAILEVTGGTRVELPVGGAARTNLRPALWDEVLRPGDVIQTWSTLDAATTFQCPADRRFGGICGHSFLFVEYVYAAGETPPADAPRTWPLIGGSGVALTTGGEVDAARPPTRELRDLHLVGLRVIDQRGYHFVARNPDHNALAVLPGKDARDRARWLESSEVWYAGRG